MGGAPKNPVWYYNVKANPRVELQDGSVTKDYEAREVFGDEKAAWWERAVEAWPDYADYQNEDRPADPGLRADPELNSPLVKTFWRETRWHH